MVQSISLDVPGLDRKTLTNSLYEINQRINPDWIKGSLRGYGIKNNPCKNCGLGIYEMADAFDRGIPTEDLTLRVIPLQGQNGHMLYGLASGAESKEKMIVKVVVLREIQRMLRTKGVTSDLDMSDVWDSDTVGDLVKYGIMPTEEIVRAKSYAKSKSQQNTTLTLPLAQSYDPDTKIEGVVPRIIDINTLKN